MTHPDRASRNDLASRAIRLKRVLFAIALDPTLKYGTLEEQIFFLARAFRDRGSLFLPVFLSPLTARDASQYQTEGIPVEHLNCSRLTIRTLLHLVQLSYRYKIELVHWNFYHPLNAYVWCLSFLKPGMKHYITDHDSRFSETSRLNGGLKRFIKRALFRRYSKVLYVSDFVMECLRSEGMWTQLSRWPHLINTDRFRPDDVVRCRIRKEFGAEKQFILLVVAHLIPAKGVDLAIRALRELPDQVVLWIVGDGEELRRLQSLSRELSLEHRVRFWGLQRNVEPFMQTADCLVCPSVWGEAAGLVNLEALGCALPVIASRTGGIPEFIEDGKIGFLFPAGDHKELAERIGRLLGDPGMWKAMGAQARSTAVERFSLQSRLEQLLGVYASVA